MDREEIPRYNQPYQQDVCMIFQVCRMLLNVENHKTPFIPLILSQRKSNAMLSDIKAKI